MTEISQEPDYTKLEQKHWATLIAFAWKNPAVYDNLRKDPKAEITRLQKLQPGDPDYLGDKAISELGKSGFYFNLPPLPIGLQDLDKAELEEFLSQNSGIFGIMQFCCV